MKIFIVIPAFNEAKRIGGVLASLKSYKLPIIVVDDGSLDKTASVVRRYKVTLIEHKVNLGKGAALKTGFEAALTMGADAVIMMDADGQHIADDLEKFVKKIQLGKYDVILGSRNILGKSPVVRGWGNKIATYIIWLLFGVRFSDLLCGYRGIAKKAYTRMSLESSGYGIETEMCIEIAKRELKYCEVPVKTVYYDKVKGVTMLDAINILFDVVKWRLAK